MKKLDFEIERDLKRINRIIGVPDDAEYGTNALVRTQVQGGIGTAVRQNVGGGEITLLNPSSRREVAIFLKGLLKGLEGLDSYKEEVAQ